MNQPPEWLQDVGLFIWSSALAAGLFWQPRWMHRFFARIARQRRNAPPPAGKLTGA